MHVAGVDGCRGGWLCLEQRDDAVRGHVFTSFGELLERLQSVSIITIDIPIGLPEFGERPCDPVARKLLGQPRASSVFPAPVRAVVLESDYKLACAKHRQIDGRALSRQAFAILPKIHEVNARLWAQPALQQRVREIHPEVCFTVWNNGAAMQHRKALPEGRAERERLIDAAWPAQRSRLVGEMRRSNYQLDDLNDAFAALWTARRIASGAAQALGSQATDRQGLRMEMWA